VIAGPGWLKVTFSMARTTTETVQVQVEKENGGKAWAGALNVLAVLVFVGERVPYRYHE
jgi:hypothetical protein